MTSRLIRTGLARPVIPDVPGGACAAPREAAGGTFRREPPAPAPPTLAAQAG
ncbi:hypothetical protein [Actinomadura sp. KC06]|uniref:hypothetical protein n=1 Tax=Actinomadura sp. KC06 TaxID=2530369 RepID=UPI0014043884|nr:hypothetical protein [Actinomadura sp. KC06]